APPIGLFFLPKRRARCPKKTTPVDAAIHVARADLASGGQAWSTIARRHGAERLSGHRNDIHSILGPVANFANTRDNEKQVPCSSVEVRCKLLARFRRK